MASTTSFLSAIKSRRTHYALSAASPIPDSRIVEIVNQVVLHTPSSFNVQSARAVVLFGDHHRKLWHMAGSKTKEVMPAGAWEGYFKKQFAAFEGSYGTVVFFEDQDVLQKTKEDKPMVAGLMDEFSHHSAGMHHFAVWTALEAEGLGASLQHTSSNPAVAAEIIKTWGLPESWTPNAQLVFGTPLTDASEKTFQPIEERVKVFA